MSLMLVFILGLWFVVFIEDIFIIEIFVLCGVNEAKYWQSLLIPTQGLPVVFQ